MPKLKPETQSARREHILDAAETCFAERGFHRTTMADICRSAQVSPGALYVYFDSKEALIAGLAERDRAEFAWQLEDVEKAPDVIGAFKAMGDYYMSPERIHKCRIGAEIGLEATRNPVIGEIYARSDREVWETLARFFGRLRAEGRIAPVLDTPTLTTAFMLIADGVFWRLTVLPEGGAQNILAIALQLIGDLLKPVLQEGRPSDNSDQAITAHP